MSRYFWSIDRIKEWLSIHHPDGQILSTHYKKNHAPLLWLCSCGNTWENSLSNIIYHKSWCPKCSIKKIGDKNRGWNIDDIRGWVDSHQPGGKVLSNSYKNAQTNMKWQCKCGHKWNAQWDPIYYKGCWCPVCSKEKREATCLLRYGVKVAIKNKDIALRCAKSSRKTIIKYHWKTNEELICTASYECKVVDYLNNNKINYLWQPEVFKLSTGNTYRPDLYLVDEDKWIEIKGYMREHSRVKWEEFKTIKPNSELWNKHFLKCKEIIR